MVQARYARCCTPDETAWQTNNYNRDTMRPKDRKATQTLLQKNYYALVVVFLFFLFCVFVFCVFVVVFAFCLLLFLFFVFVFFLFFFVFGTLFRICWAPCMCRFAGAHYFIRRPCAAFFLRYQSMVCAVVCRNKKQKRKSHDPEGAVGCNCLSEVVASRTFVRAPWPEH